LKTRHSLDVPFPRRAKPKHEELPFHIQALEFCRMVPPQAAVVMQAANEAKRILILFDRRAYCLECKSDQGELEPEQRGAHAQLQSALIPVETVRRIEEVYLRLEQFGLPVRGLRTEESYQRFNSNVVGRGGYVHP